MKAVATTTIVNFIILSLSLSKIYLVAQKTIDIANNKYPAYTTAKKFIDTIEKNLEEGDMVFELPYDNWPSSQLSGSYQLHIGYIESEGIQWSYGAMQGREEAKWQEYVEKQDADEMVKLLREEGYDGIYMDKTLYEKKYGDEITESKINDLSLATGFEPLISKNGKMIFWKIVGDQETKGEEQ